MKRVAKRMILTAISAILAIAFIVLSFWAEQYTYVYAAESVTSLESTRVTEDLSGDQIAEIEASYPKKGMYLVSLAEYCFPYNPEYAGNFGLYAYVYNPEGKSFVVNGANKISMRLNDKSGEKNYEKYTLKYLDGTEEGKIIKFRIREDSTKSGAIFETLQKNRTDRLYDVSEIELVMNGGENATSYTVGKRYEYTGFAKGYGQSGKNESTIDCYCEDLTVLPEIEVKHTSYVPKDGTNGKANTRDMLSSVYFTLPNEIETTDGTKVNLKEEYGALYAVHAQWLEAITDWIYVTGNQEVYNAFLPNVGVKNPVSDYGFIADGYCDYQYGNYEFSGKYGYCVPEDQRTISGSFDFKAEEEIETLRYLFQAAGSGENNADTYVLSGEAIREYAAEYSRTHGDLIEGTRYSKELFESYADQMTEKNLTSDDKLSLTTMTFSSVWKKLWGIATESNFNVSAIQEVTKCESAEQVENDYYVNQSDFAEFKEKYNEADSTLYVFHFAVSDYYSAEAYEVHTEGDGFFDTKVTYDTNAYLAKMNVYLNFDVIDMTFRTTDGKTTVLGVVSDPIDIFPDAAHPVDPTPENEDLSQIVKMLKLIISIVLGVGALILILVFIPPLAKVIVFVISLPFKAIAALFKAIFHKRK